MLSHFDEDIIRRDPALPGLATVLDPEAFAAVLSASSTIGNCENASVTYTKYKPGTSCLVGYRVEVAGTDVYVHATAYRPDMAAKFFKPKRRRAAAGALGWGYVVLPELCIAVSVFPNDSELESLVPLSNDARRAQLLSKIAPRQPELWSGTVRTLGYKPERRFVAQLSIEGTPRLVLKAYTKANYEPARNNSKALESRELLRIPRRIGRASRVLAFEWLDGRLLRAVLTDDQLDYSAVSRVGAALSELHAQKSNKLAQRMRGDEAAALLAVADGIGFIHPGLSKQAQTLAQRLAARLEQEPICRRAIHGDFYARQVLLNGEQVAIIDLDEAATGDPAADLGNFIAHLERDALRGDLLPERVQPVRDALLEGYATATKISVPSRTQLYAAAGLLRIAIEPFRYREPDWATHMAAIMERTQALLDSAPVAPSRITSVRTGTPSIPVTDAYCAASDPQMPFLANALNSADVERELSHRLPYSNVRICAIRVSRYKPGRRCLIEYDLITECGAMLTVIGKVRAKGLDKSGYAVVEALWNAGFDDDSVDGISIPQPLGVVPEFQMWLQRKVPGVMSTRLLTEAGSTTLARRIAEAAHKLHQTQVPARRSHAMQDELDILHDRLDRVAQMFPQWKERVVRLREACKEFGESIPSPQVCGIHRDFYADQVLVDGERLYLLDLDLYCEGDPALDIGNFIGHITEQSLRAFGDPLALSDVEVAIEERFVELSGESTREAVRAYAVLTLARHIYLSTQFAQRRPFTERLLELCEQRLGIMACAVVSKRIDKVTNLTCKKF